MSEKILMKVCLFCVSVLAFGILYYKVIGYDNFTSDLRRTTTPDEATKLFDLIYFSAITQSTVGLGDVAPRTRTGQLLVIVQVIATLIIASL
tara:strand:- start:423 stop:698 length:276 start_codon:yes stop_codon:yes gene_type:complete